MISNEIKLEEVFGDSGKRGVLTSLNLEDISDNLPYNLEELFEKSLSGQTISREQALYLVELEDEYLPHLLLIASELRNRGKGRTLTYSKNIFIPLTRLCRDHCGYCTFKMEPEQGELFVPPGEICFVLIPPHTYQSDNQPLFYIPYLIGPFYIPHKKAPVYHPKRIITRYTRDPHLSLPNQLFPREEQRAHLAQAPF